MRFRRQAYGFTLLELLVVVTVMAAIAGAAIATLGVRRQADAQTQIAQAEMLELKKAVLQFKQDTGWLPKQGPFALVGDHPLARLDPNDASHWPVYLAAVSPEQRKAWFHSPANFWQLFENPLSEDRNNNDMLDVGEDTNANGVIDLLHPLGEWDPVSRRGWRGAYISRTGNAFVDLGAFDPNFDPPMTWNPTSGSIVTDVPAVCDPFVLPPIGSYFQSRSRPRDPETNHARWGRPYFAFDLHDSAAARIVGMGAKGKYEGGGDNDLALFILR